MGFSVSNNPGNSPEHDEEEDFGDENLLGKSSEEMESEIMALREQIALLEAQTHLIQENGISFSSLVTQFQDDDEGDPAAGSPGDSNDHEISQGIEVEEKVDSCAYEVVVVEESAEESVEEILPAEESVEEFVEEIPVEEPEYEMGNERELVSGDEGEDLEGFETEERMEEEIRQEECASSVDNDIEETNHVESKLSSKNEAETESSNSPSSWNSFDDKMSEFMRRRDALFAAHKNQANKLQSLKKL